MISGNIGLFVSERSCKYGMSSALFYEWRAKFGAMDAPMGSEVKAMTEHGRATNACPPGIFLSKAPARK